VKGKDAFDGRQRFVTSPLATVTTSDVAQAAAMAAGSGFYRGTVEVVNPDGTLVVDVNGMGMRTCPNFSRATVGERDQVVLTLAGPSFVVMGRRDPLPVTDPGGGGGILPLIPFVPIPMPPLFDQRVSDMTPLYNDSSSRYTSLERDPSMPYHRNGAWVRDHDDVFGMGAGAIITSRYLDDALIVIGPAGETRVLAATRLGSLFWFDGRLWNTLAYVVDPDTGENVPATSGTQICTVDLATGVKTGAYLVAALPDRLWALGAPLTFEGPYEIYYLSAGDTEWSVFAPPDSLPDSIEFPDFITVDAFQTRWGGLARGTDAAYATLWADWTVTGDFITGPTQYIQRTLMAYRVGWDGGPTLAAGNWLPTGWWYHPTALITEDATNGRTPLGPVVGVYGERVTFAGTQPYLKLTIATGSDVPRSFDEPEPVEHQLEVPLLGDLRPPLGTSQLSGHLQVLPHPVRGYIVFGSWSGQLGTRRAYRSFVLHWDVLVKWDTDGNLNYLTNGLYVIWTSYAVGDPPTQIIGMDFDERDPYTLRWITSTETLGPSSERYPHKDVQVDLHEATSQPPPA
jgi:hypothetical protein